MIGTPCTSFRVGTRTRSYDLTVRAPTGRIRLSVRAAASALSSTPSRAKIAVAASSALVPSSQAMRPQRERRSRSRPARSRRSRARAAAPCCASGSVLAPCEAGAADAFQQRLNGRRQALSRHRARASPPRACPPRRVGAAAASELRAARLELEQERPRADRVECRQGAGEQLVGVGVAAGRARRGGRGSRATTAEISR